MGTFAFRLEWLDGTPADPPSFKSTVLRWECGYTIALGRDRMLRVVASGLRKVRTATRFRCSWSSPPETEESTSKFQPGAVAPNSSGAEKVNSSHGRMNLRRRQGFDA
jgi:hypothetical protein